MAIYGSLGEVNVGALSATTADNAVDVFVYDTRKDSDGGQWRKRTQHTSWYNETLNTATRGSRRDFPAVAVIVATAALTRKVYIYDGDDPDLPMWMVIDTTDGQWQQTEFSSLYALNGIIALGSASNTQPLYETRNRLDLYYFVSDKIISSGDGTGNSYYGIVEGIVNRRTHSSNRGTSIGETVYQLVNHSVNDVAMTVLPSAPIDDATGLPIPTIAVATNGGTSIIRDNGNVVNITYDNFNVANLVHFTKDNKIATFTDSGTGGARFYRIYDIPSSNLNGGGYNNMGSALRAYNGDTVSYNYPIRYFWYSNTVDTQNFYANALVYAKDGPVFGRNGRGIALISEGHTNLPGEIIPTLSTSAGMVCGISSSANTGWMHGDIKGAWLSDTSTASVTRTNLITNSTFESTTAWSVGSSNGVLSVNGSNQLVITNSGGINGRAISNTFNTISGKQYVFTVDAISSTGGATFRMEVRGPELVYDTFTSGQTGQIFFTGTGSTMYVELYCIGANGLTATYDNAFVVECENDRSVNNNGLAVYGTITKTPVATGSNLVAYSGFSASNYLLQPNATPPGAGNFSLSFWIRPGTLNSGSGSYFHLFSLGTSTTAGQASPTGFVLKMTTDSGASSNGYIPYFYSVSTDFGTYDANVYFPLGTWSHCVAGRNGNVFYMYINGTLVKTGTTSTTNFTNTYLSIGHPVNNFSNEQGGNAQVSLLRYSTTFPSPEQIRKIYEDEKALFQPNSQCTLYGPSDAVTALAYDDTTKLLSVGTSSGRSDFQGLERINNTTTAVTTAISASNGLIAEQ